MGGFAGIDVGTITLPVATGGNTPLTYSISGLPSGLTFTASSREVTGTATATGAFNVTYAVEDDDGDTDASGFVWRIADYDDTGKTVSARMYVVAGDAETVPRWSTRHVVARERRRHRRCGHHHQPDTLSDSTGFAVPE